MSKKYDSKSSWASDDSASNLLGSILDDTRDAALAETKQLTEAVEAKRHAEAEAKRHAEQQRRADTASRLEKEAARQAMLAQRRTAAMQAITAADAPPEPEPAQVTQEPLPEIAVEPLAPITPLPVPQAPAPAPAMAQPAPQSRLLWFAVAAVALLAIGGATLVAAIATTGYTPDQTPYPKVVMHPTLTRDLVTGEAFRPIPEEEAPAAIEEKEGKKTRAGKVKRTGKTRPAVKRPGKPKKPSFDEMFGNDDDIFGTMDKPGK